MKFQPIMRDEGKKGIYVIQNISSVLIDNSNLLKKILLKLLADIKSELKNLRFWCRNHNIYLSHDFLEEIRTQIEQGYRYRFNLNYINSISYKVRSHLMSSDQH